ncbi:MAG: winged helix-turn-helix domain-containing protein [Candidatus Diapherotrites archaeon]
MYFGETESNEVKFDSSELKVLASGTRVEILKNLKERNYTVSELAQKIGHSKSTMHEHLERLMNANLIEKADNYTDKWVYYRLSRRGKELFADSGKRVVMLISSVFLAIGIMMIALSFFSASLFLPSQLMAGAPGPEMKAQSDNILVKNYAVTVATPSAEEGAVDRAQATVAGAPPSAEEAAPLPEPSQAEAKAQEFPFLLAGGILFIVAAFIVGQKYRTSPDKMFLEKKKGKKWGFEEKR